MKLRKILLVFSLVALMSLLFVFTVNAELEPTRVNMAFFESIEVTEDNERKDIIHKLFDGSIDCSGISEDGIKDIEKQSAWMGGIGDYILFTFPEEVIVTNMVFYLTGNWTWANVEFFDAKGESVHLVQGDSYDHRIVANSSPYGEDGGGDPHVVFQKGDLDRTNAPMETLKVKQIKITVDSLKWSRHSTYTISEIDITVLHEHAFTTEGDYIKYPTCAYDGLVESICMCGKTGEKPVSASGLHRSFERIVFRNGFTEPGYKTMVCLTCDTQDQLDYEGRIDIGPLFSTLGYSVREDGKSGIQLGIAPNFDNIDFYNSISPVPLQYGTISGSINVLEEGVTNPLEIDEDSNVAIVSDKLIIKDYTNLNYSIISCKIAGFSSAFHNTELFLSAYVYDGFSIYYLGSETSKDALTVSYNGLLGIEPPPADVEADIPKE